MKITKETFEKLAAIEHRRWSRWMSHLFSRGKMHVDGRFTIDAASVLRWSRQKETDYFDLSESEKESDRKEVREYLRVLGVEVEEVEHDAE